ncbi:hypothetical protein V6N11_038031 [Hibiscus sabdariffa]|uniref:Secreted protein n=1 Tax=Hibiscus sabdariffa TaxID=183260 RepID=A0ABR1Z6D3_9ROSI
MRVAVVVRPCLEALVAMALALAQRSSGLCTTVASSCCPAHANRSRFSFYGTNYCHGQFGKFQFHFSDAQHALALPLHRLVTGNDTGHLPITEVFLQTVQPLSQPSLAPIHCCVHGDCFLSFPYFTIREGFALHLQHRRAKGPLCPKSRFRFMALVVAFCGARPRPSLEDTLHAAWPLVGFSVPYPGFVPHLYCLARLVHCQPCLHRLGVCRELSWPLLVWPNASTACYIPSLMLGICLALSANPRLCPLAARFTAPMVPLCHEQDAGLVDWMPLESFRGLFVPCWFGVQVYVGLISLGRCLAPQDFSFWPLRASYHRLPFLPYYTL